MAKNIANYYETKRSLSNAKAAAAAAAVAVTAADSTATLGGNSSASSSQAIVGKTLDGSLILNDLICDTDFHKLHADTAAIGGRHCLTWSNRSSGRFSVSSINPTRSLVNPDDSYSPASSTSSTLGRVSRLSNS